MPNIQGIIMSKAKADAFVASAFEAAKGYGYCEESVSNVLESLGFEVSGTTAEVTLRVRLTDLPFGFDPKTADWTSSEFNVWGTEFGDNAYVENLEFVSAK